MPQDTINVNPQNIGYLDTPMSDVEVLVDGDTEAQRLGAVLAAGAGTVSVTDAGSGNIVVNPTPGVTTFTLDLGPILSGIITINGGDDDFTIQGTFPGSIIAIQPVSGVNQAGNGIRAGRVRVVASNGGNSTGGGGNGGAGSEVKLGAGPGGNGNGAGNGGAGGDIILDLTTAMPGTGGAPGRHGLLLALGLPTSDPGVSGALWNDTGTIKISP